MEALANLNGEIMPLEQVRISALDRGFLFGDAIYEVLRVYQGKPWLEQEHFERLWLRTKVMSPVSLPAHAVVDIGAG